MTKNITTWRPGNGCTIQLDCTDPNNPVPIEKADDLVTVRGPGFEDFTLNDLYAACMQHSATQNEQAQIEQDAVEKAKTKEMIAAIAAADPEDLATLGDALKNE